MKKIAQLLSIGLLSLLTMACQFNSENLPRGITFVVALNS